MAARYFLLEARKDTSRSVAPRNVTPFSAARSNLTLVKTAPSRFRPRRSEYVKSTPVKAQCSKTVRRRSVIRSFTSMSAASANRVPVSPDLLKSVRTRMEPRKLARASSIVDMFASVRLAPSKLASAASLRLNELPARSACEKSEPRSTLASNVPPRTSTPAKSLPPSSLVSNLVTSCRSSDRERLETSCTVCSISPILSMVNSKAAASSLPSALSSRNRSCRSASRSAFSSLMLFAPSCGAKTPSTYSSILSFIGFVSSQQCVEHALRVLPVALVSGIGRSALLRDPEVLAVGTLGDQLDDFVAIAVGFRQQPQDHRVGIPTQQIGCDLAGAHLTTSCEQCMSWYCVCQGSGDVTLHGWV